MRFCLLPEGEQEDPVIIPPLWSLLVYILLVETRDIDDETLRRELGLVSFAVPTLESKTAQGRLCSGGLATTAETDESKAHSGALIEVGNISFSSFCTIVPTNLSRLQRP